MPPCATAGLTPRCPWRRFFAVITTKGVDGDQKLARMCRAMKEAGVFYHTFDAKTGAPYRVTRLGTTLARLTAYADANSFNTGFKEDAIKAACAKAKLILENHPGADWCERA